MRLLIFFFFLLLSVVFWFLTALNKDYNTVLSYPVKYIMFPKDKVLENDVPDRLDLTVQSRGFTLLRFKLKSKLIPIIFDVNSFSLNTIPGRKPLTVFILTDYAVEKIQEQLSGEIKIISISPDTLYFQLTEMYSKALPVEINLELEFEKQYMQVGKITVIPDSIEVKGPFTRLDTLRSAGTMPRKLTGLRKTTELDLKLKSISHLEFSENEVRVVIPIEKFTEETIKIPLAVINLPDSLFLRAFPNTIEVTYRVGLNDYGKVNEHMFRAIVDYSSAGSNIGNRLRVDLIKKPEYIQVTDFHPRNVEYIIER